MSVPFGILLLLPFPAASIASNRSRWRLLTIHGVSFPILMVSQLIWWSGIALIMVLCVLVLGYLVDLPGFEFPLSYSLPYLINALVTGMVGVVATAFFIGAIAKTARTARIVCCFGIIIVIIFSVYSSPSSMLGLVPPLAFFAIFRYNTISVSTGASDPLLVALVGGDHADMVGIMMVTSVVLFFISCSLVQPAGPSKKAIQANKRGRSRESSIGKAQRDAHTMGRDTDLLLPLRDAPSSEHPDDSLDDDPLIVPVHDMLAVSSVHHKYRAGPHALRGVDLTLRTGGSLALLGCNGSGKTTLMNLIMGNMLVQEGDITLREHIDLTTERAAWRHIGNMPQHDLYFPFLTVRQHLQLVVDVRGITTTDPDSSPGHLIDRLVTVMKLSQHQYKRASELSGGMRRRLSLAMAILGATSILMADEPCTGLDCVTKRAIWQSLLAVANTSPLLLTTHDLDACEVLSDTCVIMNRGRVIANGSPSSLRDSVSSTLVLSVQLPHSTTSEQVSRLLGSIRVQIGDVVSTDLVQRTKPVLKVTFAPTVNLVSLYTYIATISSKHYMWSIQLTSLESVFLEMVDSKKRHRSIAASHISPIK
eukprot:gnl/Dysnectes_brevis/5944_a8857_330.p1 GENE.gnl/Dysnectes_brevis/5944_a8857_330~~gnl/Dysnectes_brevis/5944_a8857_330.p1  ORF type:complete len:664 (+),score=124.80 gnl/Dysnectes_brevis/5944_a8857_330:222-1994(+)